MEKQFKILKTNRLLIPNIIENLTLDQLNKIPDGFKNNIAWNVVHLFVTQQLLCYRLSGLDVLINNNFVEKYRKGSAPTAELDEKELKAVKNNFVSLAERLKEDYNSNKFKEYQPYPTSTGIVLNTIDDAIAFNNFHEGIHLGIILSLKKLV